MDVGKGLIPETSHQGALAVPNCPRCRQISRIDARFCYACGLSLSPGVDGTFAAGRVPHPHPQEPPGNCRLVEAAADLHYCYESALNGPLLIGTEGVQIRVFNAGYGLQDCLFQISGVGERGPLFTVERMAPELPQGATVTLEVPSYEFNAPLQELTVRLMRAEFVPPP